MISLKDAKEIVKKIIGEYDTIYDYGNAYYFWDSKYRFDGDVVVMKKDGGIMSMAEYVMSNNIDIEPKLIEGEESGH